MEVSGKLHALAALSPGQKRPVRQWTPIAGLGAVNKIFFCFPRESNSDSSVIRPIRSYYTETEAGPASVSFY